MKLSEPNLEDSGRQQHEKPDGLCKNMKCCPINNTLNIIGKKFTLLLLRNMMLLKQTRFNQFMDSIEQINPKTLSLRLKEMEKDGLIQRKVYQETPVRVEYVLTEKAMALTPIIWEPLTMATARASLLAILAAIPCSLSRPATCWQASKKPATGDPG